MLKLVIIFAVAAVYSVHGQNGYFLSTRDNIHAPEWLIPHGSLPTDSFFNPQDRTILLIHDDSGSQNSRFNRLVTEVILGLKEPTNIIVVDWLNDAQYSYSISSARVPSVARDLEHFLRWLHESVGVDISKVHLVGFGLGAHVAGIAARWYNQFGSSFRHRVGRITGLDPSGSGWDSRSLVLRSDDADYVEVLHTDGSGLLANGIGSDIGRVNFYANGGSNQPGCLTHSCSHDRAYELFAASMVNPNLVGYPCTSMTQMNFNNCKGSPLTMGGTDLNKHYYHNIYRINTGRNYPY